MTTESLFNDIYQDVCTNDYCSICFRTCKESRLLDGKNLAKFKFFRKSNYLEVTEDIDRFCTQKICYMCDAQAIAANKFCLAVNLSHHIHSLFHKMKREPMFYKQVKEHLTNGGKPGALVYNLRNVEDLQQMLEQHRRNTTLLQTETLLLNNPGDECPEEPPASTARAAATPARESLRDLLTFESNSGLDDDTLFDFDAAGIEKQIIIEDDDLIKEEPPDQNVFIIPDELPQAAQPVQTNTQTDNTAGYLLHPIVLQNGTLTVPPLVKNISIKQPNHIVNGFANNTNNNSSLNHFVVVPQTTSNTQIVGTNSNQNMPQFNFIQNTNSLAQDIVSLVKNPTFNFIQNKSNLSQNTATLERHTVSLLQNTSNLMQNKLTSTQKPIIVQNMSSVMENTLSLPNIVPFNKIIPVKLTASPIKVNTAPVKVTASPVKRSDSDSDTNCQNIQPLRKPEGKIDWEDKIPMDVISFVSPSDLTTKAVKRQKTTCYGGRIETSVDRDDPMGECIITDVKSVRELEVIDLC